LLVLPAVLLGLALLGLNTEPGRVALARLAGTLVPGLVLEGLEGPLPGRPGVARLALADEQGVWLEVEDARLVWDPRALLRREAHVEALTAGRIALRRLPAAEPAEPGPPGPLLPELPQLPLALRLDRLEVARIELGAPVLGEAVALRAAASLRLDPWGLSLGLDAGALEGGTSLTLDAVLRPASGRLTARGALRGAPGGPLSHLAGLGERPIALDLTLDGPTEGAAFALSASAGDGVGADLAGTVAAPDTARLGAALEGRVDASGMLAPPLAGLAGPLDVRLDAARMPDGLVDLRALRVAGTAGVLEGSGRLDLDAARSAVTLRAALPPSEVFAGLLPEEQVGWAAVEAEAEVTGSLAAPRIALTVAPAGFTSSIAPLAALLGPAPRLALRTTLGPEGPERIELLTIAGQALQAALSGRVARDLDVTFAADIAAPGEAIPGLNGALRVRGTAQGDLADPTLALEAQSARLEAAGRVVEELNLTARIATPATRPALDARATGRLQELPLSLSLRGYPEDAGWLRLDAAEAALGPLTLTAAGRLHPTQLRADGKARLAAEDLAPLAPLLGQPLAGGFTLSATGAPEGATQRIEARLEAPAIAVAGTEARRLDARIVGTLEDLEIALSGIVSGIEAEARGRLATEAEGARRFDLAALRATGFGETIRLAQPTRVTHRPDGAVELAATTLALPRAGTLRAAGRWGPERADLRATLAGVNLAAFAPLLPDLAPAGTVTGEARVTGPVAAPELVATLRGSGLRATATRGLPPGEVRVELRRAGAGAVTANAEARLGPQQRLAATARFPQGPGAAQPFEATLDGALDLAQISAPFLAAGADRVGGALALALRATGTPAEPVLGGEARLSGGRYRNGVLGIAITDIAGTLRPEGRRLRADITARTPGEGRIALAGTIEPLSPLLPLDLTLAATGAQPVTSDLLRATLDAELRLAGQLGAEATLSGPVRIQRAELRIPDQLGGGVRSLRPVTERGTPRGRAPAPPAVRPARQAAQPDAPAAAEAGPPILLALQVIAPRAVYVRGRGLEAELGGEIGVRGRIAAPEITGALDLRRGEIAIAGRRLAFDRGRLAWDGALLPDLNLRASNQSGSYTARVEVLGSPTAPEIIFSAVPELPPDEVLARLFFGRPLRELSPLEVAQIAAGLAGNAGLMPGGGGGGILGRLQEGLGLDRLAVGSETERATRSGTGEGERTGPTLEAGRYVADGVYVGVKQGTEPGTSRVGVRVDLTPRLRLEAETGDREAGNRVGLSVEWQWGR
jgi:translocation and assembly module TamB